MPSLIVGIDKFEDLCETCNDYELYELFDGKLDNYAFAAILIEAMVLSQSVEAIAEYAVIRISTETGIDFVDCELTETILEISKSPEASSLSRDICFALHNAADKFKIRKSTQVRVRASGGKLIIKVD